MRLDFSFPFERPEHRMSVCGTVWFPFLPSRLLPSSIPPHSLLRFKKHLRGVIICVSVLLEPKLLEAGGQVLCFLSRVLPQCSCWWWCCYVKCLPTGSNSWPHSNGISQVCILLTFSKLFCYFACFSQECCVVSGLAKYLHFSSWETCQEPHHGHHTWENFPMTLIICGKGKEWVPFLIFFSFWVPTWRQQRAPDHTKATLTVNDLLVVKIIH